MRTIAHRVSVAALLLSCTREAPTPTQATVQQPAPTPATEPEPATEPAPVERPGKLVDLLIDEGWGCVIDEAGALWCWGRHPRHAIDAVSPWTATRVPMPGPVRAIATQRLARYPPTFVTCASFAAADVECWEHTTYKVSSWGKPFAGTAGALDLGVYPHGGGTGSEFLCARMPNDELPCFSYYEPEAPEQTLREIIDIESAQELVALTRDGRVLKLLEIVSEYGQAELRLNQKLGKVRGAGRVFASPRGSVCVLDQHDQMRCIDDRGQPGAKVLAALREVEGPLRSIALTTSHGCVLTQSGAVACAGDDRWGQLGAERATGVLDLAVAPEQTCVMTATSVRCWGRNAALDVDHEHSELDLDARRITSRYHRTCIVDGKQQTWCWGEGIERRGPTRVHLPIGAPIAIGGEVGECFIDDTRTMVCGELVPDPADPEALTLADMSGPEQVVAVSTGGDVAQLQAGKLRLLDATLRNPVLPGPVTELARVGPIEACALLDSGEIHCWRLDEGPEKAMVSRQQIELTDAIDIAGRCAIRASGRVSCWGGATEEDIALEGAKDIQASDSIVCAQLQDDSLRCANIDSFARDDATPPALEPIVDFAAGHDFFCAAQRSGKVVCWGDNQHGQLGTLPRNVSPTGRDIDFGAAAQ